MEQQTPTGPIDQANQPSEIRTGIKKPILIIGEVAVLVLAILACLYFFFDVGKSPALLIEEKKVDLIERVNEADKKPLTEAEKIEIINKYGGDKTAQYNFSDEQTKKILKALNSK